MLTNMFTLTQAMTLYIPISHGKRTVVSWGGAVFDPSNHDDLVPTQACTHSLNSPDFDSTSEK